MSEEFSGHFTVAATQILRERFLNPATGEVLTNDATHPYELRWSAAYPAAAYEYLTLSYSPNGGTTWNVISDQMTIGNGGYFYNPPPGNYNWCHFAPTAAMRSGQARLKLTFHLGPGVASEAQSELFVVYPLAARFEDVTDQQYVLQGRVVGQPASVVPIEVGDPGGQIDVLVSVAGAGTVPPEGKLYVNIGDLNGDLRLDDRTFAYLGSHFNTPYGSLAVADFDNDGDDDFFACQPGAERSKLFKRDGAGFNPSDPPGVSP